MCLYLSCACQCVCFSHDVCAGPASVIFSYVFFIGDLNYRIGLNRSDVLEKIRTKQFAYLQEYDQVLFLSLEGNIVQ